jgi:hypothetical protein
MEHSITPVAIYGKLYVPMYEVTDILEKEFPTLALDAKEKDVSIVELVTVEKFKEAEKTAADNKIVEIFKDSFPIKLVEWKTDISPVRHA